MFPHRMSLTLAATALQYCEDYSAIGYPSFAITQDFNLLDRECRNYRDVRTLGAIRDTAAEKGNNRCAMTAFTINEDQGRIRSEAPEVCRPDDSRCI